MAASQEPWEKTTSRCAAETDRCSHVFEIHNYSLHKGIGAGRCIRSATFTVGGHDWLVGFCPDGNSSEESKDHFYVYIKLQGNGAEVRALVSFSLVNQDTTLPSLVCTPMEAPVFFNDVDPSWGVRFLKSRSELEASSYLRDDRLVIHCDVTVITGTKVSQSEKKCCIQVPPSDLSHGFGRLFNAAERTDVAFKVKGEVFRAHKIVLATRSPVFKAELYGTVREGSRETVTIQDMEPAVFKALLQFIYTDSLPALDDLDGDERQEKSKHFLVAADRYAMERMKLMCESVLCKGLKVENVAETLALADQHHCIELKNACIAFINSLKRMDAVMESSGYKHLKRACPDVFIDMWEKVAKSRRI
ncbi:unnamed protein product [Urochloa decumbens]|uniref:Uncharacterized protein n=1 Tax=Urochloa decumbens TaxID=240449 RepID=A0ABC9BW22_9POAL